MARMPPESDMAADRAEAFGLLPIGWRATAPLARMAAGAISNTAEAGLAVVWRCTSKQTYSLGKRTHSAVTGRSQAERGLFTCANRPMSLAGSQSRMGG